MMLTRETILSIYEEQGIEGVIAATLQMQAALLERIVRLEERLGLDSHNSSKPPSSDGPEASGSRSERRKAQRKSGGQPGHRGSTLRRVAEPDEVITHTPAECAACGCSLAGVEPESVEEQGRQVFDIPPIDMQVTEHRRAQCRCGCGHLTRADYPLDVGAPVQYGPRILALGLLLNLGHHLPLDRTRQILVDLCGAAPSQAVLIDAQQRLARAVEPSYEVIIDHLLSAEQLFVDESGVAVEGELFWVHVASTPQATLLAIDQHRGREAIEAIGLLPEYRAGQLMHDFWGSYRDLPAASHGYCSAHLLRNTRASVHGADLIVGPSTLPMSSARQLLRAMPRSATDLMPSPLRCAALYTVATGTGSIVAKNSSPTDRPVEPSSICCVDFRGMPRRSSPSWRT